MHFIKHRVNTLEELSLLPPDFGAEIDLRSTKGNDKKLCLSHDPWVEGVDFEKWMQVFVSKKIQGTLILNTKEDGLESEIIKILNRFSIENYFFLDTTFPTQVHWAKNSTEVRFAIRYSRYEPFNVIENLQKFSWLWVDCFDGIPVNDDVLIELTERFKICLVSPELQGKDVSDCHLFSKLYKLVDAICTKYPEAWQQSFS